jgi:hypothetical protein
MCVYSQKDLENPFSVFDVGTYYFYYCYWIPPLYQPISPVRAETEIKLGGTQCNIIMNRLKPLLLLQLSKKKKKVLREQTSVVVKPQSTDGKIIMWTCNVSAPEMTIVLFDMVGSPVYHVSIVLICVFIIV